jgi:hypothetical protein
MSLETDKFILIKNAISRETCKLLAREFRIARDLAATVEYPGEEFPYRDIQVERSFSWDSPLCIEALSDSLIKEVVENELKEAVYPTYSYARIYYNGAEMPIHIDRSSSEYSVSCCIDVEIDNPWHLGIETIRGETLYVEQEPGDIILYKGNELKHWRNPYKGTEQINAFMFYVKANGPRAELKYDTRPLLGMGSHSRRMTSEQQWEKYPSAVK